MLKSALTELGYSGHVVLRGESDYRDYQNIQTDYERCGNRASFLRGLLSLGITGEQARRHLSGERFSCIWAG